eukprot:GEMP01073586.1.p1 GENE.GEMP01073586.1~~GEMP01073586.1.p1  ORF type:complete len:154 (+),score=16.96 GEMP01073586.1:242-703(+)
MALFYSLFVGQLGWVSAEMYADLLAMAQSLPGPSAMQVLMTASSVSTHTFMGGVLAFLLFSIPCAILFAWLGVHVSQIPNCTAPAALGCAAIAVVASGAIQLKTKLVKDKLTYFVFACSQKFVNFFWLYIALCIRSRDKCVFYPHKYAVCQNC